MINDVFNEQDLDFFLQLDAVQFAKSRVVDSYSFTIDVPPFIQETIFHKLGIHVSTVPMRWIKGDTKPHIDTCNTKFNQTHLIYITDSEGEFVIDKESYPIQKNTAFIFSEGIPHKTVNTGSEPRLLLGPMSEDGIQVGVNITPNNISYPGNTTVYIRYVEGDIQFSTDQDIWYYTNFPCLVTNTDTNAGILQIIFINDITINNSNYYYICQSDNIQFGSTSLNDSGLRNEITIDNVTDYPGLIQNGTSTTKGFNYIYVFNIKMNATNSNLFQYGGWVGQQYFGSGIENSETFTTNNYFVNCHTTGEIASDCGGIVGGDCGHYGFVTLRHCSSTGLIGQYSGGIVGPNSGYYALVTCEECWSEGILSNEGGGIFGKNGGNRGQAVANKCYSEGNIIFRGGGIFSSFAGASSGSATATHCYSKGTIGEGAGGIIGCYSAHDSGSVTVTNCFSIGIIETDYTDDGAGIVSSYHTGTNVTQTNVYAANGIWDKVNAIENLTGTPIDTIIGEHYSESHDGEHFRIHGLGHSPYVQEMIQIVEGTPELVKTHYETITFGESSSPAISGSDYRILNTTIGISPSIIRSYSTVQDLTNAPMISTVDGAININHNISSLNETTILNVTIYHSGSYHISNVVLTIEPASNIPICFPAGTPILTDQGEFPIENLKIELHTIDSKPIVAITKTIPLDSYIICIDKNSLGANVPSKRTFMSKDHKVLYQQKLIPAENLPKSIKVKYNGQILYNVLLKEYSTMKVNGLTVETLHPNNTLAKIYSSDFTLEEKQHLIASSNRFNLQRKTIQRKPQATKSNFFKFIYQ